MLNVCFEDPGMSGVRLSAVHNSFVNTLATGAENCWSEWRGYNFRLACNSLVNLLDFIAWRKVDFN